MTNTEVACAAAVIKHHNVMTMYYYNLAQFRVHGSPAWASVFLASCKEVEKQRKLYWPEALKLQQYSEERHWQSEAEKVDNGNTHEICQHCKQKIPARLGKCFRCGKFLENNKLADTI